MRGDALGLRGSTRSASSTSILTSETNDAVPARARKIRIECVRGIEDKLPVLRERARAARRLARRDGVPRQRHQRRRVPRRGRAARRPGRRLARGRAARAARARARGGYGCVREFCDAVWNAKRAVARRDRPAVRSRGPRRRRHRRDGPARAGVPRRARRARRCASRASTSRPAHVPDGVRAYEVDVTDRASIARALDDVVAEMGRPARPRQQRRLSTRRPTPRPRRSDRSRSTRRRRSTR